MQQERARKQTRLMVGLFFVAVVLIVLSINITGGLIYIYASDIPPFPVLAALQAVPHSAYWITTAVVVGVIAWGTLTRMYDLSGSGAAVALMVGARRVRRDTTDTAERRLMNIVEEMAIASGIAVPQVYVVDEQPGINAFAAGYSPNQAAVTVTSGTLAELDRDQLQGVVAHEFSHILNGDMRLNVRLIGVVAGLIMVSGLGRFLMRINGNWGGGRSRKSGDIRIFAVGVLIWLIGAVGVLFGNIIKAAISRQREFLADASAVQFTRNPDGIGGALLRIGQTGSQLEVRHAEELSHMYFSDGVQNWLGGWFATHPPLEERIRRLMGQRVSPPATGTRPASGERAIASFAGVAPKAPAGVPGAQAGHRVPSASTALGAGPLDILGSVGNITDTDRAISQNLLASLPAQVHAAVETEAGAMAALCALLLGKDDVRAAQLEKIDQAIGSSIAFSTAEIADAVAPLGPRARLPILELSVPTLEFTSQADRDRLLSLLRKLALADARITLREFVLLTLCRHHLAPRQPPPRAKYRTLRSAAEPVAIVVALVARSIGVDPSHEARVLSSLGVRARRGAAPSLDRVEAALHELNKLVPKARPALILACIDLMMSDGRMAPSEAELLRALCAALDAPLPPSLGRQEPDLRA